MRPSRNTNVFTAPARSAEGERRSHRVKAASLWGTVTLAPRKPRSARARTESAKRSGRTGSGR